MAVSSIDLEYPFTGRWLVQNSPADRVPSHGTALLATSCAIDFVPTDDAGRTAPITFSTFMRPEPAERFPGFGRVLLSPVEGIVVAAHDTEPDHPAHRGLPSLGYALTQRRRLRAGWTALAGNHVLIESRGIVVALCHLRRGSLHVRTGQHVQRGGVLAQCGNSGNSTEPHVHIQAMTALAVEHAAAVPLTFRGALPRNGEVIDVGE
ncbi:M23 family metallopeptidase [Brachybacterium sp. DNPG3]